MSKRKDNQNLLPAAQQELDQKVQQCTRSAYHAEAFNAVELIARGMKMQAIRKVVENSEILELKGVKRIEDYFESLGISRQTGFNLKKIAETFSEGEVQLLYSMGLSQRGILKLASLPPGQRPDLSETDDPDELKAAIDALVNENKSIKIAAIKVQKDNEDIRKENKDLKSRLPNQHNLDWAWLSMESISRHIAGIQSDINYLLESKNHRFIENPEFKARITALYQVSYRMHVEIFDKIDELVGFHPGREQQSE